MTERVNSKKKADASLITLYNDRGQAFWDKKKIDEALDSFKLAYEICIEQRDFKLIAATAHNIALCYEEKGNASSAHTYFEKELTSRLEFQDKHEPLVLKAKSDVAACHFSMGKYEEAVKMFKDVYLLRSKHQLGDDEASTIRAQHNFGLALVANGNKKEGITNLQECLERSKGVHGDKGDTQLVSRTLKQCTSRGGCVIS